MHCQPSGALLLRNGNVDRLERPPEQGVNRTVSRQNAAWERRLAEQHFANVAPRYEALRETDDDAIVLIGDRLPDRPLVGADIGAGTGRYTELLRKEVPDGTTIIAVDLSHEMLRALTRETYDSPPVVRCETERLPLRTGALDFVTTFNAIHHFDLDAFVDEMARVLRDDGQLFVYTRTPEQNAQSIWGQAFPGFLAHEQRLHSEGTLRSVLGRLGAVESRSFRFPRRATATRLAERVRGGGYSTFSLYDPRTLEDALQDFLTHVDGHEVEWHDENLLVHVRRPA
jgi:ubiquinone/menaquinone biosynthesis C-methylase UbiE